MRKKAVSLKITKAEVLVLYEFLVKFNDLKNFHFEDQAGQRVLWDLEAMLEQELFEILVNNSDYQKDLEKARKEVRGAQ